ncbi:restriction endonuclease subunit S [Streptococcus parasanguinis]|uniref:restriction endonuclease subunit S n=1 Tax=Streptococcus parasanguinis TaxID=1318 RepID=UPI0020C8A7CE|nr:restriction endonuclease subunit S [Streptococcus parasanguinis]MCP9067141.1 restriction endonuclease subunit S [Streptococcus parasanguinis]
MKKQSNAPQIRFQNFEDEWLDSTIGRHISLLNGRAYKQEELLDEGKYKVLRVGNFNTNSKWYYSNLELEENKYVNKGDLLYLWATNFGPEIWTEEKAIYHYHIWKLDFDRTEINQDYLNIWLERDKNKIQQNTNGSTMVHITKTMMEERGISLPNFDEQSAIGSLFRTLDDLLASYKDNLANYQSLKATMLSKMFPKAGQTIPEIRLDGFEGEWGNAIINDYVTLLNGRAFKQDELLDEGKYRVVRVGNFNTNEKWYYSNLELEENKYAYKGDLLYLWATNFGPEIWKEEKIIFHYHIWKFEFDRSIIDRNYLYYWLEKDKKRIQQNTNGSTMVHVTKSIMENRELIFPMYREQQAIGAYFSNLDNLINSHQEKISQLETLKKKLLQDMFL